jgi:hypothetical protein
MAVGVDIVSTFKDKGVKDAKSSLSSLTGSVKVAGAAFAASFAAIGAGLAFAAKAAAEDEKSFTQLALTLKNVAGASDEAAAAIDKQLGKMAIASGVADDKLRPALSTLVRATGDVSKAQSVLSLAMDISAGTGRDLDSVSLALAKAYGGNVAGLSKLGVTLSEEAKTTKDFALVQKELADIFGGASAENANTFAGRIERLKIVLGEMVETVGSWLLPILSNLAEVLNNVLGRAFTFLSDEIGPRVSEAMAKIGDVIQKHVVPIINDYLVPAFQFLYGEIQDKVVPVFRMFQDVIVERAGKALGMFRKILDDNRESFDRMRETLSTVLTVVRDKIAPAFIAFTDVLFNIGLKVIPLVINGLFKLYDVFGPIISGAARAVGAIVDGIVRTVNVAIDAINMLITGWNKIPDWLRPGGTVSLLPRVGLPDVGGTSGVGGNTFFGENRGAMGAMPALPGGGLDIGPGAAAGGRSGGRTSGGMSAEGGSGPSAASLGLALDLSNWQPPEGFLAGYDPFAGTGITVNVNGGLATSADIGAAVVDAIRQYNQVSGPANIAVA